ncbi:MAG: WXG100 family type VII secretion target [Oscillibacter sp.]|nr:WXG100 family type VII secretion target [Oscillibacter sp.]MBQ7682483.1 WXG100 family type VII secretion target [Oscillibacter sp.]MBQ9618284.1 WXG100 family type VII secretion target [Oscillibacter sp.]
MTLAYEANTDLAFDTDKMRECGRQYAEIADELRGMAAKINALLSDLNTSGWTSPAGSAFQAMVETNWEENIQKYASLLDTLRDILERAASKYDDLIRDYVEPLTL